MDAEPLELAIRVLDAICACREPRIVDVIALRNSLNRAKRNSSHCANSPAALLFGSGQGHNQLPPLERIGKIADWKGPRPGIESFVA